MVSKKRWQADSRTSLHKNNSSDDVCRTVTYPGSLDILGHPGSLNSSGIEPSPSRFISPLPGTYIKYEIEERYRQIEGSKHQSGCVNILEEYLTKIEWYALFSVANFEFENVVWYSCCDFDRKEWCGMYEIRWDEMFLHVEWGVESMACHEMVQQDI